MILLIGSHALKHHYPMFARESIDYDYIARPKDVPFLLEEHGQYTSQWNTKRGIVWFYGTRANPKKIVEIELAVPSDPPNTGLWLLKLEEEFYPKQAANDIKPASREALLGLKRSHRFLRNSPHFEKTWNDINFLQEKGVGIAQYGKHYTWYLAREEETLDYGHPKLNQSKKDFFSDDGLTYIYDHDSIHEAVKVMDRPAYQRFKVPGEEVKCSKELFEAQNEHTKLCAVFEESMVLALERSQIPYKGEVDPYDSFVMALQKVCTSITSGWFREYAWQNYYVVKGMYNKAYADNFWKAVEDGKVKLHEQ